MKKVNNELRRFTNRVAENPLGESGLGIATDYVIEGIGKITGMEAMQEAIEAQNAQIAEQAKQAAEQSRIDRINQAANESGGPLIRLGGRRSELQDQFSGASDTMGITTNTGLRV